MLYSLCSHKDILRHNASRFSTQNLKVKINKSSKVFKRSSVMQFDHDTRLNIVLDFGYHVYHIICVCIVTYQTVIWSPDTLRPTVSH